MKYFAWITILALPIFACSTMPAISDKGTDKDSDMVSEKRQASCL